MTMFTAKHYPEFITPRELDAYLARGWYRMGQTIFTTHFLCFEDKFYSAIWIRLPLQGYRFRKSLRKILNKNLRAFRTVIREAALDEEKETLYQKYRADFTGMLAPTLVDSLQDGESFNLFRSLEVAVYDDDRLVAFSFFDLGEKATSSILGVYDPDYSRQSLGFFTMLMEIRHSMYEGFDYYYPGYVVPGYPRFDYKARIGQVEYFDLRTGDWEDFSAFKPDDAPIRRMETQLKALQRVLLQKGFYSRMLYYPLFEANLFGFWRVPFFDHPVMLLCSEPQDAQFFLIAVFDPRSQQFQLLKCSRFDEVQFYFNESYVNHFSREGFFLDLLALEEVIEHQKDKDTMAQTITGISFRADW